MHNKPLNLLISPQGIATPSSPSRPTSTTRTISSGTVTSKQQTSPSLRSLIRLLLLATPIATTRSFLVASTTNSNPAPRLPQASTTTPTKEDTCPAAADSYGSRRSSALLSSATDNSKSTPSNPQRHSNAEASTASLTTTAPTTMVLPRYRSIRRIMTKPHPHWVGDGFKVLPVFSNLAFTEAVSPFLMFDYGEPQTFPPQSPGSPPHGVGQHPHRGFETVTIAFQGEVEHHDSAGNRGVIGPGDVQWMTAGRGIVHEEYHSKEFAKKGGTLEMCQLWVNLPAEHKMTPPKYQEIVSSDIPVVELKGRMGDDDEETSVVGTARIVAGELLGTKGAASTFSPVQVWDVVLPRKGARVELPLPAHHNAMLFVRRGRIEVLPTPGSSNGNGKMTLGPQDVALLDYDEAATATTESDATASAVAFQVLDPDTSVVVLGGQPLGEPIANHGPFVMNTQEEIRQAFADYRSGKMGK